jgi:hypothetical protein
MSDLYLNYKPDSFEAPFADTISLTLKAYTEVVATTVEGRSCRAVDALRSPCIAVSRRLNYRWSDSIRLFA